MLRKTLGLAVVLVLTVLMSVACSSGGSPTASETPPSPNFTAPMVYEREVSPSEEDSFQEFKEDNPTVTVRLISGKETFFSGKPSRINNKRFEKDIVFEEVPGQGLRLFIQVADRARFNRDEDGEFIRKSHMEGTRFTLCGVRITDEAVKKDGAASFADVLLKPGCRVSW